MKTSITLCLDFGNSRKKLAVFHNKKIKAQRVLTSDNPAEIEPVLKEFKPQKSILSSVINHNPLLEEQLKTATVFHKLSAATKINFTTPVAKPETIGADRLAMVAAAVHFFPKKNNLVIGLGSCITYNFINQLHEFLGGAISPGMQMRFKAMHEFTALLPLVEEDWNFPLIGYDTKTNLQSGVLNGMASEIDGIINRYRAKYRNFNVVLTGGNTAHFASRLKNKIFADPNFLFKGLYALSEYNNNNGA
ncbi:MAG TPA: type III pantothenate kinase [Ferruginibacter sp.]|jgi:type III pantothenate kinase|nr:type III pantothenate kinase [Chitinophagaceae bacterium]HMT95190.1 type III pantothenate kinase [Ferruginibacter sp.]HMU23575.1 type III pantothenate kinase [Ferruginibacter sp.]